MQKGQRKSRPTRTSTRQASANQLFLKLLIIAGLLSTSLLPGLGMMQARAQEMDDVRERQESKAQTADSAIFLPLIQNGQPGVPPVITSLVAIPTTIDPGGSAALLWTTTGQVDKLTLEPGIGDVTGQTNAVVTPSTTTIYTLTASGPGGSDTETVVVTVVGSPTIDSFTATPATIGPGGSSTLAWNVSGQTDSLSITPDVGDVTGQTSAIVSPSQTTTYVLTARNAAGTDTAQAMVTVIGPPVITSFVATPGTIDPGGSATLSWTIDGQVDSLSIAPNVGDVTGQASVSVSPGETTTYVLTATNSAGSDTEQVTVVVGSQPPVISSFAAAPGMITLGESTTLSWSIAGQVDSVSITPGVGDVTGQTSTVISPTQSTTFILTASNSAGSASAQAVVLVRPSENELLIFDWDGPVTKAEHGMPGLDEAILPWANGDWTTPVNFAQGTLYYRVQVRSQPVEQQMQLQWCAWQDASALLNCGGIRSFSGVPGTVRTWSSGIQEMWKQDGVSIDWTRARQAYATIVKNNSGQPVSDLENWNWSGENPDAWYPLDMRFSVVVVAKGATFSGWPTWIAGQPPIINSFSAVPQSIDQGASSTLSWNISGQVDSLTIAPEVGDVTGQASVVVSPAQTTTYILTASNSAGSSTSQVTVIVGPQPPIIASFTATPDIIDPGQSAMLSWTLLGNADSVSISPGIGDVTGQTSVSVSPSQVTTYILTASNSYGSDTAQVVVTVRTGLKELMVFDWNGPATKADHGIPGLDKAIMAGANGDWTTPTNFAQGTLYYRVQIRNQPVTQEMQMQWCAWQDNSVVQNCGPTKSLSGTPGTVLTWSSSVENMWKLLDVPVDWSRARQAYAAVIKNSSGLPVSDLNNWNWSGENPDAWYPLDMRFSVVVVAKGETFSGWDNWIQPPVIQSFTATPQAINQGQSTTLNWSVSGRVDSLTIAPGIGDVTGQTSVSVSPIQNTTYTLTATSSDGSDTAEVTVVVGPQPPIITSFTATPDIINQGETATLNWNVVGQVNSATITPDVGLVTGQTSAVVQPGQTTTYLLTATNSYGSDTAQVKVIVGAAGEMLIFDWDGPVTQAEHGFPGLEESILPGANGNWTSPTNYAEGTLQYRVQVRSQPVPQQMKMQWCVWQDNSALQNCGTVKDVPGTTGSVATWSSTVPTMWKQDGIPIDWTRARQAYAAVIKNNASLPVSDLNGWNWSGEDPSQWYPLNMRFSVVVVAKGKNFSGWQNWFQGPVITSFTATPQTINQGESATLSWSVSGQVDSLTITPGVGNVTGLTSVAVSPAQTTTYVLTASSSSGSDIAQAVVTVNQGPPPPTVTSFVATPAAIYQGQSSTLSWTTDGQVDSLSISPGVGVVTGQTSVTVSPAQTTIYTLTASNENGSDTEQVTVTVNPGSPPPDITSFTATPSSIDPGGSSNLSWTINGTVDSLTLAPGIGDITGQSSVIVAPSETTTFVLTATNSVGSDTAEVTVVVGQSAPIITSFVAAPGTIYQGESSTLSWSIANQVDSVSISPGVGNVTGQTSVVVSPTSTTTYVLSATNSNGTSVAQVVVTVNLGPPPPQITSFTAAPNPINPGSSSTLSWTVTGQVDHLTLDPGGTDVTGQTSAIVSPSETTTYVLTATNVSGSNSAQVIVTVNATPQPPVITSFTATPSSISTGNSSTLNWTIDGSVDSLSLTPGVGDVTGQSSQIVSPGTTTTYLLTATNSGGSDTEQVVVTVGSGGTELLVYDWNKPVTKSNHGFPMNQPPMAEANGDWTSPTNFEEGTLYFRVQIRSQPVAQQMKLQICFWQDSLTLEECGSLKNVTGTPGTVATWSTNMQDMYRKNGVPIDWSQPRQRVSAAIKNMAGDPVSDYSGWDWNGEDPDEWYPLDMRFTAVVVAKGATFSGWSNWITP